jgi:hypothetical protein
MAIVGISKDSKSKSSSVGAVHMKPSEVIAMVGMFKVNKNKALDMLAKKLNLPIEDTAKLQQVLNDNDKLSEITTVVMANADDLLEGNLTPDVITEIKNIAGIKIA